MSYGQASFKLRGRKAYTRGIDAMKTLAFLLLVPMASAATMPKTRADNVTETLHGIVVKDPYRWLEDQTSPETRAWIDAQNAYTRSQLDPLPTRERLSRRLEALLKTDRFTAPRVENGRYFFLRRMAGQNQHALCLRRGRDGKDEVLLDPNTLFPEQTTSVFIADVSRDGKWLLYGTRLGGEDEFAVTILDVDAGKPLADHLPRARYSSLYLTADKTTLYYSKRLDEGARVYVHAVGSDSATDREIFGKGVKPEHEVDVDLSPDGRYLAFSISHGWGKQTEIYLQDLRSKGPIAPIVNDIDAEFSGAFGAGQLFLKTNWQAPNGRIFAVDLAKPARANWHEIVKESASVIEEFTAAGGSLAVKYLENVNSRVRIVDTAGKHIRDIAFPTLGTVTGMAGRWDVDETFYTFASFAQPPTTYRYQMASGKQDVWARIDVPVDPAQFEVKQVWYESKDKTRIPMFLVHKKGLALDGNRPTLLYGYGGFLVNLTPFFSADAVVWAEQGGVFAVPNIRGGGEFGEKWHRAGMLEKKQNVFDDFIAAGEWLTHNGYTKPERLAIQGGSNGGLLVGAVMIERPDLVRAVVCEYPLLDMVRYQRFLIAPLWVPEYGSSEEAKPFEFIYKYSPYHHVKDGGKYPAVLFVTGDSDTRVAPLHARKMTARMQAANGSDRPILLHYDTKSGHSGGMPVTQQVADQTDILSFLLWQLGVL
jgi:prolyl oligopeptidase